MPAATQNRVRFYGRLLSFTAAVAIFSSSGCLYAQSLKDTLSLPEFEIRTNFIINNQGFKRIKLDSSIFVPNLTADLSGILADHSSVFIKSYGNGTLATPSFRGTSAQHTQVEWNGISLNSPMLGQVDFSQIPVAQFDGLEILYGAAGISRTSGAFGGVIDLVTMPDWNNKLKGFIAQSVASFANFTTNANVAAGGTSFQSHTRLNFTTAKNDFPFTDDTGRTLYQQNAAWTDMGISQELFWKIRDRHLLSARAWYSQDDRELPPTTQQYGDSVMRSERMNDRAFRAIAEYKYVAEKWNISARSALNNQYMKYSNSLPVMESVHRFYSLINRIRATYSGVKNLVIRPGLDFTYDHVNSDEYEGTKTRATTNFSAELQYTPMSWFRSSLVLREELIDGRFSPLIPALGLEFLPFSSVDLAFSCNAARNYRYPTLNELYWKNMGNPNLKPETNYSVEAGSTFGWKPKGLNFGIEATLNGYYSWIYDMIAWTPSEESSWIFTPENVDEIHARGLEAGLNINLMVSGFGLRMKNNYTFCRSTYEKANSSYDDKIGKQQIYMPVNTFNTTVSVERWNFYLIYNFVFTGERYTGKDNLSLMPAYNLSNIILGKNIRHRFFILSLQLDINNLFNLDYQSVASRPMPGINWAVTAKFAIDGGKGR